jgi:RNA polymerase sigma factor (sigma-70 family)
MMLKRAGQLMHKRGMDRDDALVHASDRLIYAARSFDPTRHASFSTFAFNCLNRWGNIRHTAQERREWAMNLPIEGTMKTRNPGRNSAEIVPDRRPDPVNADEIERLRAAMAQLPERTATVLALRSRGYTLEWVAKNAVGASRQRVQQIERRGLRELKAILTPAGGAG